MTDTNHPPMSANHPPMGVSGEATAAELPADAQVRGSKFDLPLPGEVSLPCDLKVDILVHEETTLEEREALVAYVKFAMKASAAAACDRLAYGPSPWRHMLFPGVRLIAAGVCALVRGAIRRVAGAPGRLMRHFRS